MAQVILVRHGQPLIEGDDPSQWRLSDRGRQVAGALSRTSIWDPVSKIYSSSEPKARETAEILAGVRGIPVRMREDLREVRRPFEATGYEDRIRAFFKGEAPPGWETREESATRIRRAMEEISESDLDVGVVSHALLLTVFISGVMGTEPTFWLHHSIGFAEYALFDPEARTLVHGFRGAEG